MSNVEDYARAAAYRVGQKRIQAARQAAARALRAPAGPKRALEQRWAAVLHPERAIPQEQWDPTTEVGP